MKVILGCDLVPTAVLHRFQQLRWEESCSQQPCLPTPTAMTSVLSLRTETKTMLFGRKCSLFLSKLSGAWWGKRRLSHLSLLGTALGVSADAYFNLGKLENGCICRGLEKPDRVAHCGNASPTVPESGFKATPLAIKRLSSGVNSAKTKMKGHPKAHVRAEAR